jgi:4-hydroxy-tetrahydrodipicolinate reductase
MGKRIVACAAEDKEFTVAGAVEHRGHPDQGKDIGELSGIGKLGVAVSDNLEAVAAGADAVIDFSFHEAAPKVVEIAAAHGKPVVVGTTGLSKAELETIGEHARKVAILIAPNMSVGANLMFSKAAEIAKILGPEYDIEVIEAHHRLKKDAPSGTAKRIAEAIAQATGRVLETCGVYGRKGDEALRRKGEIGIHAVRGGDIIGDHTVLYCANGERIELIHRAHSRDTFAKGSLRGAAFVAAARPGLYDMQDVLQV